jgi:hypothetical protein
VTLDTALRRVASTVLAKLGTPVTIRRVTPGTYSTTTRSHTPTVADTTAKGRLDDYRDRELSNTILAGDRKLTIAAASLSYEPSPKDRVVIGAVDYEIVNVTHHRAQDEAALYELQLRR